jgi:hypothetical protein
VEGGLMSLWCKDLPFVEVPQGGTPKPVTIAVPYYENPQFLRQQLGWWSTYPKHVASHLSFIVVDDGSPDFPAELAIGGHPLPESFRLFRIETDVRWNWLAARNIAAHHAADGWILLTDIDHVVPASTAEALVYGKHDPSTVYALSRREHTGAPAFPHSASFLLTRAMFWAIGGYDETFSGYYGTDGLYRRRVAVTAKMAVLRDVLVRHEYQGDSSTARYLRKQPEDAAVRRIAQGLPRMHTPKVLSFPYHEVRSAVFA